MTEIEDVDALYAGSLKSFVTARNDLVKALKRAGKKGEASEIEGLQKPPPSAWALNQIARVAPAIVARFIAAVDRQSAAQLGALSKGGDAASMREATQEERASVAAILAATGKALSADGLGATRAILDRVSTTARGAALDPEGRRLLVAGRLARDYEEAGFDALAALMGSVDGGGAAATPPAALMGSAASAPAESAPATTAASAKASAPGATNIALADIAASSSPANDASAPAERAAPARRGRKAAAASEDDGRAEAAREQEARERQARETRERETREREAREREAREREVKLRQTHAALERARKLQAEIVQQRERAHADLDGSKRRLVESMEAVQRAQQRLELAQAELAQKTRDAAEAEEEVTRLEREEQALRR